MRQADSVFCRLRYRRFYVCASICPILALCHLVRRSYRVEQSQHLFQLARCLIGYFDFYHGWLLSAYSFRNVAINTIISAHNEPCKTLSFLLASCASVKSSTLVFSCVLSISAHSWFSDCSRTFAFVRFRSQRLPYSFRFQLFHFWKELEDYITGAMLGFDRFRPYGFGIGVPLP